MKAEGMPVSIRGRFRRSVNLARDFYGDHGLEGYIITVKGRQLLDRMADALESDQAQRAWSIFGPYGGGKSAFGLFASYLMRGSKKARRRLKEADPTLARRFSKYRKAGFCPVLIVGSREPLTHALLWGLSEALPPFARTLADEQQARLRALADEAAEAFEAKSDDEERIVSLYQQAAAAVAGATGGGLFIVLDEMGKLLEYAALYPEATDLYLLQRLAERASRTGDTPETSAPILLLTILHQAFDRYARRMNRMQQEEWRKVQGRFEDFAFIEPVDETLRLLAHAIECDEGAAPTATFQKTVDRLLDEANLPAHFDVEQVRQHLIDAFPLHPAVSLLVGPLFRRLAQNERSLFAFLASGEPDSFLDVMQKAQQRRPSLPGDEGASEPLPLYKLDHLYAYLVGALGATLFYEGMNRLWAETEVALSRIEKPTELSIRLLKQIVLLSFAGDYAGLKPTTEVLYITADAPLDAAKEALTRLLDSRVVVHRQFSDEYHIWQGSDFNIDEKLAEARTQVPLRTPLADMLQEALPPAPVTARRHSYRTGTNRFCEVKYASEATWPALLEQSPEQADGRIIYVLPELGGDKDKLIASIQYAARDPLTLVAVPDGVDRLREAVRDLACLDWVRSHSPGLDGDAAARMEVDHQRADLSGYIQAQLSSLLIADAQGRNPCLWINQNKTFRLTNERGLQEKLSELCDAVYAKSPEIWNELLNRRKPSSNANRALKLLLEAMLEHPGKEALGIKGTPAEYGLYASILKATGMHRQVEDTWLFGPPFEKKRGCVAVWKAVERRLRAAKGKRVSVRTLYALLAAPPYGVREGLTPIFLFAFHKYAEDEIACYEEGVFLAELTFAEIERLVRAPDRFDFQWVEVKDARADVIEQLAPLVGLSETTRKPLPVVLELLRNIRKLKRYVRRTASLSSTALAVREALQRAEEPTTLLFEDLPEACGIHSFLESTSNEQAGVFVERLREALRELGGAYDALIASIDEQLKTAFGLRTPDADSRRHELAERARPLLPHATQTNLKAFLVRATDEIHDTQGWYESLAALLAKSPPAQWLDHHRDAFRTALTEVARRFHTLEPLVFDSSGFVGETESDAGHSSVQRMRLGVTSLGEPEREAVVSVHVEDQAYVDRLTERLEHLLNEDETESPDAKLAALGQLTKKLLAERDMQLDQREAS